MSAETPLQFDMFSGALVDTRSASQRARDREREKPHQIEMFAQRDLAQYVRRPLLPLPPETKLHLMIQDPRTEEERERDALRAAQEQTYTLFSAAQTMAEEAPLPPPCITTSLGVEETPTLAAPSEISHTVWSFPSATEWLTETFIDAPGRAHFGTRLSVPSLPPSLI